MPGEKKNETNLSNELIGLSFVIKSGMCISSEIIIKIQLKVMTNSFQSELKQVCKCFIRVSDQSWNDSFDQS